MESGIVIIVLISTYWNVNSFIIFRSKQSHLVLISTYWNVNSTEPTSSSSGDNVLISTYWNVNTHSRNVGGSASEF